MSDVANRLLDEIKSLNPMQEKFLNASSSSLAEEEIAFLEAYIQYALETGLDYGTLARAYDVIVRDTMREQIHFLKHGSYRYSTYEEVASSVYLNDDYMSLYMHGLALTSCLWPNHRRLTRYFRESLPRTKGGTYLEVGPGHGVHLMFAMKRGSFQTYEAIDISPTSVRLTEAILGSKRFGSFSGYRIRQGDFLDMEAPAPFDALVMGEVLEHVEEPLRFLSKIRAITNPHAFIFLTTCINAPAIDHISLFESAEHLCRLIREAGLVVVDQMEVPYVGLTIEECRKQKMPINIGFVLGHP